MAAPQRIVDGSNWNGAPNASEGHADAGQSAKRPGALYLTAFTNLYAPLIASWVRDRRELLWLAPGTLWPLTAHKVVEWGRGRDQRLMLHTPQHDLPIGYAEINLMPAGRNRMWIGHFIIDPDRRGQGWGVRFAGALLARAFLQCDAIEVLLVVFPDNVDAIRCYERAGLRSLGRERRYFKETGREHLFLRMGITRSRFDRQARAGRLPAAPMPYRPSAGS